LLVLFVGIYTVSQKTDRYDNMTELHQFSTFTDYFWRRQTLLNSQFTKLKDFF